MKWFPAHEGCRLAGNSNGELDASRGGALAHGVIAVIGAIECVVGVDVEPVRAAKHTLPPGAQEVSLAIEHHHRMFPAVENVNLVLAVDPDGGDVLERPPVGQFRPVLHHPIAMLAAAQNYRHCVLPLPRHGWHVLAPGRCRLKLLLPRPLAPKLLLSKWRSTGAAASCRRWLIRSLRRSSGAACRSRTSTDGPCRSCPRPATPRPRR